MLDLTLPIICKDDWWGVIHMQHVNEHLTYLENIKLLKLSCDTMCIRWLDKLLICNTYSGLEKVYLVIGRIHTCITNNTL